MREVTSRDVADIVEVAFKVGFNASVGKAQEYTLQKLEKQIVEMEEHSKKIA